MNSERWEQIEELYHSTLELEADSRRAFLDVACAGDESLLQEVLSLLSEAGRDDAFLEEPALGLVLVLMGDEDDSAVGKTVGPYKLLGLLGRGGMGEVYLAHDPRLNRRVALKMLPVIISSDHGRARRFMQEAHTSSSISHPNVAHVYEIGEEQGQRYITMEYVAGLTLRDVLKRGPLPTRKAVDIAAQVAAALRAAHEAGVVHRDVKPENIMLRDDGYVKVLDFGLAKFLEGAGQAPVPAPSLSTETEWLMGTYDYMSPEQVRREPVDESTDLWSLGVVLYEMLAGRRPFTGESASDVFKSVLEQEPEPLGNLKPDLPAALLGVVSKALRKRPEERYRTAKEFAAELRLARPLLNKGRGDPAPPGGRQELKLLQCRLDGRYDIFEYLARDNHAEFYLARDVAFGGSPQTVVIKALNVNIHGSIASALEQKIVENLRNETTALVRIRHPNIINHLHYGTAIDLAGATFKYLVLEYLAGGDLEGLCSGNPLALDRALYYLNQVCEGLAYAHEHNVIHGNIEPRHLILTIDREVVKIADFGAAKLDLAERAITLDKTGIYAAPEHSSRGRTGSSDRLNRPQAARLTPAADIYSLAKTAYMLLTGEAPRRYSQKQIKELPPHIAGQSWAGQVLSVLRRATELKPNKRYQTAHEFWDALSKGIPLSARSFKRSNGVEQSQGLDEQSPLTPADRSVQADITERRGRELLFRHNYSEAISMVSKAMALDSDRTDRLKEEFGFILALSAKLTGNNLITESEQAQLRWQTNVWNILSEHNNFQLLLLEERPLKVVEVADTETGETESKILAHTDFTVEQRGEMLEQAVLSLFKEFFRLGENDEEALQKLKKLRQQHRGTQFGFDIGVEFDCVLEWNRTIRCHVECKNLSGKITLKDIADKLISQSHFDKGVDLWILISPHADPANELEQILESWRPHSPYPFDVRIWSPASGVADFFGLEPPVYDLFFQHEEGQPHPKDWDSVKRDAVRERWKQELSPPLRLPKGWDQYLRKPYLMCLRREESKVLDATFANHVTMQCKNEAGTLMPQPLEHYIHEWLAERDKPVLFLLGEFGDGKTFFTYTLARRLADEFLKNPKTGWIPLRLSLRDFYEAGTSRDFLRLRLEEFGADIEGWTTLLASQRLLIILDGFDEISKQLDPATITKNITALMKCYEEFNGCKVMITSRTHFFERRQDVERLMTRLSDPALYYLAPISRRATVQHLEETAHRLELKQAMTKLHSLHDPIGLAAKPLFLQMVKDTLHDLPDDLDEVTLYQQYILNSLKRKAEQLDDDELLVDRKELLDNLILLLEEIAVELQISGNEYVSLNRFAEIRQKNFAELLWKMTGEDDAQQDAKARVGVRSLLSRVETPHMENEWPVDFYHRSLREYFVARRLCSSLLDGATGGEQFLKEVSVNHEILDFAAMYMRKTDVRQWQDALLRLIHQAKPKRNPGRLGGNAITLLYKISSSLPDTDWTRKVFDYADLEGADLSRRSFQGSSFRAANLTNVNFEYSNFENCDFTGVRVEETAAVNSIAILPSGDRILAIYGDGTAREWSIKHPRKIDSRSIATQMSRQQATLGILREGFSWIRDSQALAFIDTSQGSEIREIARFPVKDSYRFELPTSSDLLVVEDLRNDAVKVLMIDLERQGITRSLETHTATLCAALAKDALVFNNQSAGLRIIDLRVDGEHASTDLSSGVVTCLSSICFQEKQHVVVCGQNDGILNAWVVDLRTKPCSVKKVLTSRVHNGLVTAVTFLDGSRIVSGGRDRAIIITRIDVEGQTLAGVLERKLQLTLQCKGMRIKGLKGSDAHLKLDELIKKAEAKTN